MFKYYTGAIITTILGFSVASMNHGAANEEAHKISEIKLVNHQPAGGPIEETAKQYASEYKHGSDLDEEIIYDDLIKAGFKQSFINVTLAYDRYNSYLSGLFYAVFQKWWMAFEPEYTYSKRGAAEYCESAVFALYKFFEITDSNSESHREVKKCYEGEPIIKELQANHLFRESPLKELTKKMSQASRDDFKKILDENIDYLITQTRSIIDELSKIYHGKSIVRIPVLRIFWFAWGLFKIYKLMETENPNFQQLKNIIETVIDEINKENNFEEILVDNITGIIGPEAT